MPSKIPSLRLHAPSGRAVVTIAGRDHYCGRWGTKAARIEYERVVGEWIASGRATVDAHCDAITVATIVTILALRWQEQAALGRNRSVR